MTAVRRRWGYLLAGVGVLTGMTMTAYLLGIRPSSKELARYNVGRLFENLEGFGLPPLEAAFCGNAVVGYTGQGAREYFEAPLFEVIESGNIHAFVQAIRRKIVAVENGLLEHPELTRQVGHLRTQYSEAKQRQCLLALAEAVRFELTEGVNPRRFSRPVP